MPRFEACYPDGDDGIVFDAADWNDAMEQALGHEDPTRTLSYLRLAPDTRAQDWLVGTLVDAPTVRQVRTLDRLDSNGAAGVNVRTTDGRELIVTVREVID